MAVDLAGRLELPVPVVVAPMAGGPSTPALVTAAGAAGGLGFLAAGYRDAGQVREQVAQVRALTARPFGVNVFVPGSAAVDRVALDAYAARLAPVAERLGVKPGEPRWDDDDYAAKLDLLVAEPVPLVSFTFGCPAQVDVERLHRAGSLVAVTVTSPAEAVSAAEAGADAVCVQGAEPGAHRGSFHDDPAEPPGAGALPLFDLIPQVRATVPLPLLAAGGLMTGADIAAVLAAGASLAQLGTASVHRAHRPRPGQRLLPGVHRRGAGRLPARAPPDPATAHRGRRAGRRRGAAPVGRRGLAAHPPAPRGRADEHPRRGGGRGARAMST